MCTQEFFLRWGKLTKLAYKLRNIKIVIYVLTKITLEKVGSITISLGTIIKVTQLFPNRPQQVLLIESFEGSLQGRLEE